MIAVVTFSGLSANATASHIHQGATGAPGGVIVPLTLGTNIATAPPTAAALSTTQFAALIAGNLYFNVHSTAHTGGEIRGQIGFDTRSATLSGANETPAVTTSATGKGGVVVDRITKAITGGITFTGLSPTQAHIHQGAVGVPGGVIIPLTLIGTDRAVIPVNTTLTDAQYTAFLAGDLYFNAHTAANPNGEIRGQITGQGVGGLAILNGAQETPAVSTSASALGTLVVDPVPDGAGNRSILIGLVTFSGITATVSHIHQAATGVAGGVIVPLTVGTDMATAAPTATLSSAQYDSLLAGNLYFNVHSAAYPSGEIRGQIRAP